MLDYCLFILFFQHQIDTFDILGEYYDFHENVSRAISNSKHQKTNNENLVLIHKETYLFIDYFWRNLLTINTKWLIIVPQNISDANRIFREMRSFGDTFFIQNPEPIIIIKNIKENFKEEFRKQILNEENNYDLDEFLEINIIEKNINCDIITGSMDSILLETLSSNSDYIYFGEQISDQNMLKNQMLSKLNFDIIENIDIKTNKTIGFFIRGDYVEKVWIYYLSKSKQLDNLFKFKQNKINSPAKIV